MTLLLAAVGASLLPNYDYNPAVIGLAPSPFAEFGITLKSAYDLDVPNGFLPPFPGKAEGMVLLMTLVLYNLILSLAGNTDGISFLSLFSSLNISLIYLSCLSSSIYCYLFSSTFLA
tara:strand:- start:458 stop:808 length:351 start_codon:yes stop_codon:yes gene_type:complete